MNMDVSPSEMDVLALRPSGQPHMFCTISLSMTPLTERSSTMISNPMTFQIEYGASAGAAII